MLGRPEPRKAENCIRCAQPIDTEKDEWVYANHTPPRENTRLDWLYAHADCNKDPALAARRMREATRAAKKDKSAGDEKSEPESDSE